MGKRKVARCSECQSEKPIQGRGLCFACYHRALYDRDTHGTPLPGQVKPLRYTDVDLAAKTLTCSIHGPGSPLQGTTNTRCSICQRGYGLTLAQRADLLTAQEGACAICRRTDVQLLTDHDHRTMVVRGLLCHRCNTGIGKFLDDPDLLLRAIEYLQAQTDPKSCTTGLGSLDSNDPDGTGSHVGVVEQTERSPRVTDRTHTQGLLGVSTPPAHTAPFAHAPL